MKSKREYLLPISLLILLGAICIYIPAKFLGDFQFYREINHSGLRSSASILKKGILVDGRISEEEYTVPSDNHVFNVDYNNKEGVKELCQLNVSKSDYDSYSIGDRLDILYLSSVTGRCMKAENAAGLYSLTIFVLLFWLIFLLIFLALAYIFYRAYKRTGDPRKLTTEFNAGKEKFICPECSTVMEEGYIPGVGGINWRERTEPPGMPTIVSGLPGTVYWMKRPMLHAFHCRDCGVVTFRYVKK